MRFLVLTVVCRKKTKTAKGLTTMRTRDVHRCGGIGVVPPFVGFEDGLPAAGYTSSFPKTNPKSTFGGCFQTAATSPRGSENRTKLQLMKVVRAPLTYKSGD